MLASDQVIQHLNSTFADLQSRRGQYSLRRFAKKLGVAAPILSEVMNRKRPISLKLAEKLLMGLSLEAGEIAKLLSRFPKRQVRATQPKKKTAAKKPLRMLELDTDSFRMISDWWYFAVLSLAETKNCKSDARWLAKRLNISVTQAATATERLLAMELITKKKGLLSASGKKFTTTNDIPSAAIRRNHAQGLELAQVALDNVPVEFREFGASIIAADPLLLDQAKIILRSARAQVSRLLESGEKKEVYRLQVQLFPLSQTVTEEVSS